MIVALPDGCEAEETVLPPLEGLSVVLKWPESPTGQNVFVQCPCGDLDTSNDKTASRVCGGNFMSGGRWENPSVQACNFSATTRRLCQVADVSRQESP